MITPIIHQAFVCFCFNCVVFDIFAVWKDFLFFCKQIQLGYTNYNHAEKQQPKN